MEIQSSANKAEVIKASSNALDEDRTRTFGLGGSVGRIGWASRARELKALRAHAFSPGARQEQVRLRRTAVRRTDGGAAVEFETLLSS